VATEQWVAVGVASVVEPLLDAALAAEASPGVALAALESDAALSVPAMVFEAAMVGAAMDLVLA
jgi:hypothetical protein